LTFLRRAAVALSERVVRWASPGGREWAEGLAREVEFIESDWRALAWAAGSTRVLLERRGVRAGADRDMKPWSLRTIHLVFLLGYYWMSLILAGDILKARSPWDRTSASLCAFAWACWIVNSIANWRRERREPPLSSDAYLPLKRKELERSLARFRTLRFRTKWRSFAILAIGSGVIGSVMQIEGGMHLHHVSSGVWIAIGVYLICGVLRVSPETMQKRIAQMDERIAGAQIAKAERMAWGGRLHSGHWGRSEAIEPEPQSLRLRDRR